MIIRTAILFFLLITIYVHGQNKDYYSDLLIGFNYSYNAANTDFSENWESSSSFGFNVSTNFSLGNLLLSYQNEMFTEKSEYLPEFELHEFSWGISRDIYFFDFLFAELVVKNGIAVMDFDSETETLENVYHFTEAEIFLVLGIKAGCKLDRFIFLPGYSHKILFTAKNIELNYYSFDVRYVFDMPKLLKDILN